MKIQQISTHKNPIKIATPQELQEFLKSQTKKELFAQVSSDVLTLASEKGAKLIVLNKDRYLNVIGGKESEPLVNLPLLDLSFLINGGKLSAIRSRIKGDVTVNNAGRAAVTSILGFAKTLEAGSRIFARNIKGPITANGGHIHAIEAGSYLEALNKGVVNIVKSSGSATATDGGSIHVKNVSGNATAGKNGIVEAQNIMYNADTYQGGKIEAQNILGHTHGENITVEGGKIYQLPWKNFDIKERFAFLRSLGGE